MEVKTYGVDWISGEGESWREMAFLGFPFISPFPFSGSLSMPVPARSKEIRDHVPHTLFNLQPAMDISQIKNVASSLGESLSNMTRSTV